MKDKLYRKFDNVKTRRGRGGNYPYVSSQDVFDRMNEIFGINWSSRVVDQEIMGNTVIIRALVQVKDPDTGRTTHQEGYGGALLDDRLEPGVPFKAAYSKAIKAACKVWGVGLYLDDEDDSEPQSPLMQGHPRTQVQFLGGMQMPRSVSMIEPPPLPETHPLPESTPVGKISDVQRAALHSILSHNKKLTPESIVGEALERNGMMREPLPSIDELTYEEAVAVVKYGNDVCRR